MGAAKKLEIAAENAEAAYRTEASELFLLMKSGRLSEKDEEALKRRIDGLLKITELSLLVRTGKLTVEERCKVIDKLEALLADMEKKGEQGKSVN